MPTLCMNCFRDTTVDYKRSLVNSLDTVTRLVALQTYGTEGGAGVVVPGVMGGGHDGADQMGTPVVHLRVHFPEKFIDFPENSSIFSDFS